MTPLSRRATALAALLVLSTAARAWADGMIILQPPTPEVRLTPLAVKEHLVSVEVQDQVAVTTVDQTFHNPNPQQLEGLYIFPLPEKAAISKFSMWIDGREQQAETLDREQARQTYEDIVRSMKDPALLEYMGTRAFRLRIFPIPPNGDKRVKLSYSEVVTNDGGVCAYRYPLNTEKFSSQPLEKTTLSVALKSTFPLKTLYSPSHNVDIARRGDHEARISFEESRTRPDKDFLLYYTISDRDFGLNLVTYRRPDEEGYFMLLCSPKAEPAADEVIAKDVVFVIDTSGSMNDEHRMEQAKKALAFCVASLRPDDRFGLISFSTEARAFRPGLQAVNDATRASAKSWIEALEARGATNLSDALAMAFDLAGPAPAPGTGADAVPPSPGAGGRPLMIVLVTDGEPTVGEVNPAAILKGVSAKNQRRARVFSLGVGYTVNAKLLDALVRENHGAGDYITPEENIELRASAFYDKISNPVLSDVGIAFRDLEVFDLYPKQVPDLFRGSQLVAFGRYRGEGAKAITLRGQVNGRPREEVFEGRFADRSEGADFLPRLWAISKIGFLLEEVRLRGETQEVKQEIVRLAKEHGILTPYTSFLVLEDVRHRRGDDPISRGLRAGAGGEEEAKMKSAADAMEADSGAGAIGASRESQQMAEGRAPAAAPPAGGGFSGGDGSWGGDSSTGVRSVARAVGQKTFYLSNGTWYDGETSKGGTATVKIKWMSDAYFALVKEKPELGRYFALGSRVVVAFAGTTYEVTE